MNDVAALQPAKNQRMHGDQADILDDALQSFFVIGLVAARALADLPPARLAEPHAAALGEIVDVASNATSRLRAALVSDDHAENGTFLHSLQRLARDYQQRTGAKVAVVVSGAETQDVALPTDVTDRLHAVSAEALAFIARKSRARAVMLGLRLARRSVTLSVKDNAGFGSRTRLPLIAPSRPVSN